MTCPSVGTGAGASIAEQKLGSKFCLVAFDADAGELELYGQPVSLPLPAGKFRELGLGFVHQHLGAFRVDGAFAAVVDEHRFT